MSNLSQKELLFNIVDYNNDLFKNVFQEIELTYREEPDYIDILADFYMSEKSMNLYQDFKEGKIEKQVISDYLIFDYVLTLLHKTTMNYLERVNSKSFQEQYLSVSRVYKSVNALVKANYNRRRSVFYQNKGLLELTSELEYIIEMLNLLYLGEKERIIEDFIKHYKDEILNVLLKEESKTDIFKNNRYTFSKLDYAIIVYYAFEAEVIKDKYKDRTNKVLSFVKKMTPHYKWSLNPDTFRKFTSQELNGFACIESKRIEYINDNMLKIKHFMLINGLTNLFQFIELENI